MKIHQSDSLWEAFHSFRSNTGGDEKRTKMNPETEIYIKLLRKLEVETAAAISSRDNLDPKQHEIESAKQLSLLTDLYLRPLYLLRSFGNHPIFFEKVKYGSTNITYHHFRIKIVSGLTLLSVLMQLFYVSGFCLLSYRCLSRTYHASIIPGSGMKAKHGSDIADGLVTAFFTIFFLVCCAGAVVSFFSSRRMAEFLNQWKDFVFLFSKTFSGHCVDYRQIKCFNYRIVITSIGICSSYLIWAPYIYRTCLLDYFFDGRCTKYEIEQSVIFVGFGCASILNLTWEQCKLAFMMRTASDAFQQIERALAKHKGDNRPVDLKQLKNVFKLTYIVRGQVKLITKIVGTSQLFVLFYLFGLTIIIWMMFFQLSGGDLTTSLVVIIASIGGVQFARFAFTSLLAESILIEEKKIVELVSSVKPRTLMGQIEIQIFVNALTKRPSEFVLDDFITYKRSLFLAIMSNCTSYLIAFQQLLDVSNSSDPGTVTNVSFVHS